MAMKNRWNEKWLFSMSYFYVNLLNILINDISKNSLLLFYNKTRTSQDCIGTYTAISQLKLTFIRPQLLKQQ